MSGASEIMEAKRVLLTAQHGTVAWAFIVSRGVRGLFNKTPSSEDAPVVATIWLLITCNARTGFLLPLPKAQNSATPGGEIVFLPCGSDSCRQGRHSGQEGRESGLVEQICLASGADILVCRAGSRQNMADRNGRVPMFGGPPGPSF